MNFGDSIINFNDSWIWFENIIQEFSNVILEIIENLVLTFETICTKDFLKSPIEFSELQLTLLEVLLFILFTNFILICFFWAKYGTVINDKFIRPSELGKIK